MTVQEVRGSKVQVQRFNGSTLDILLRSVNYTRVDLFARALTQSQYLGLVLGIYRGFDRSIAIMVQNEIRC